MLSAKSSERGSVCRELRERCYRDLAEGCCLQRAEGGLVSTWVRKTLSRIDNFLALGDNELPSHSSFISVFFYVICF